MYAQLATEVMCDRNDCYPALKGEALYRDDDHVSPAGGRLLLEALEQQSPGFLRLPERRASVR